MLRRGVVRGHSGPARRRSRSRPRPRRQTSTATGAAASQVGPRALAWAAWLHTALGVPFAKVAMILRTGCGLTIYGGVVVRDGWAPYRKFPHATHQTCLAHYADLRIMPTRAWKPASEAGIAVTRSA